MSALRLPVAVTSPRFGFTTELDGVTYGLSFRWNQRVGGWYFDLLDGEGEALLSGLRLAINVAFLARFRAAGRPNLPPGELLALDTSQADEDAAFGDLGQRVLLYYLPVADLDANGL